VVPRRLAAGLSLLAVGTVLGCGGGSEDRGVGKPIKLDRPGARDLAVGRGAVWVADNTGVKRIDPRTQKIVARIGAAGAQRFTTWTTAAAATEQGVWAIVGFDGPRVRAVDAAANRFGAPLSPAVDNGFDLVVAEDFLWALVGAPLRVLQIDPQVGRVVREFPIPGQAGHIAVGAGNVWVSSPLEDRVTRIDLRTRPPVIQPIALAGRPNGITVAADSVWVALEKGRAVARLDAATSRVVGKPITMGFAPRRLAADAKSVWVLGEDDGRALLARVDIRRARQVGKSRRVGRRGGSVAVGEGAVWVLDPGRSAQADPEVKAIDASVRRVEVD
jgi:streptogramin lyase